MAEHLAIKFTCDGCWTQTDPMPVGIVELDGSLLPTGWFKIHIYGEQDNIEANIDVTMQVCGDCHDSMFDGLNARRKKIFDSRKAETNP